MSRPATGRTTQLSHPSQPVIVPIRFEAQVKALIRQLKEEEALKQAKGVK